MNREHFSLSEDGYERYCKHHVSHGNLYPCPFYSKEQLKELHGLAEKFREECQTGIIKINVNGIIKSANEWNNLL